MSDIEENQLESFRRRMLEPPFVCPVCEKKPACITTTLTSTTYDVSSGWIDVADQIDWRSCMDCFREMKSDKNSVLNST